LGRATGAVATVSAVSAGKGGPPSVDPPGIYILAHVPGVPAYQRGHLVAGSSDRSLGGPGNTITNLVPMAPRTNSPSIRDGPEKTAVDLIYDTSVHPLYMLRYSVEARYAADSELRSLLTSFGIAPSKASDLYQAARNNVDLTDSQINAILSPPQSSLIAAQCVAVRKMLAYCFMPRAFNFTITPIQGQVHNVLNFSVSNHEGVTLP
jgi:hypothetical protein